MERMVTLGPAAALSARTCAKTDQRSSEFFGSRHQRREQLVLIVVVDAIDQETDYRRLGVCRARCTRDTTRSSHADRATETEVLE